MSSKVGVEHAKLIPDVGRDRDGTGDDESEVGKSRETEVEVMLFVKHEDEYFEPGVEDGVDESDVRVCDEDTGFETKPQRPIHVLLDVRPDALVSSRSELGGGLDLGVSGELAEALSAAEEYRVLVRLGEQDEEDREGDTADPNHLEERPPPPHVLGCETADDGTEHWSADCAHTPAALQHVEEARNNSSVTAARAIAKWQCLRRTRAMA